MIKPYTGEELKSELKRLGLTQQWLADKCHVSRQYVCGVLGNHDWITTTKPKRDRCMLFWTYIVKDYEADILRARALPLLQPKH